MIEYQNVCRLLKENISVFQMSLLTEIRSSVAPRDIDRFDDLVLKKEIEIMKVCISTRLIVLRGRFNELRLDGLHKLMDRV